MFKIVKTIREHRNLTQKLKRERKRNAEATERVMRDQQIRTEVLNYLSVNGMLKENIS